MVHLYLGDGKGKTTAALGLAVRILGWDRKVLLAQFLKSFDTGEYAFLSSQKGIVYIRPFMHNKGFLWEMNSEAVEVTKDDIRKGFQDICRQIMSDKFSLIILDEILDAIECGFVSEDSVLELIDNYPAEYVLTGRRASEKIKEKADYITVMVKEKHPFEKGIAARKGIEF